MPALRARATPPRCHNTSSSEGSDPQDANASNGLRGWRPKANRRSIGTGGRRNRGHEWSLATSARDRRTPVSRSKFTDNEGGDAPRGAPIHCVRATIRLAGRTGHCVPVTRSRDRRSVSTTLNVGELLNLVGLSTGVVLYAMLLAMVVRAARTPGLKSGFDPLLLLTSLLGLVWNLCALPAYELPKIGDRRAVPVSGCRRIRCARLPAGGRRALRPQGRASNRARRSQERTRGRSPTRSVVLPPCCTSPPHGRRPQFRLRSACDC